MNKNEAMQRALGYAWGREDASGQLTAGDPNATTTCEFATAYAAGWEDYNTEKRGNMTPVRDAYERWQATGGRSIFRDGDSTQDQQARLAQLRTQLLEGAK